jgi:hypothetical protein
LYDVLQGIRRHDSKFLYAFDYGTYCSSRNSTTIASSSDTQGGSSRALQHKSNSAQAANSSESQYTDHVVGNSSLRRCNQQVYGHDVPPFYNMSAITTPLALFSGAPSKPYLYDLMYCCLLGA